MSSFRLQSGDSEFNSRVDALFSSLQSVSVDLQASQGTKRPHEDNEANAAVGDDGGEFCKPQGMPPPWRGGRGRGRGRGRGPRNSTPDYIKNPSKWTRYSMKDTKVLSDRENEIEGLRLFQELRTRRLQKEQGSGDGDGNDEPVTSCDKIVFKKPVKPSTDPMDVEMAKEEESHQVESSADALFGGQQKFRLPQYEVGKSKSKPKPKKQSNEKIDKDEKEASNKEVKLGHLMFEEEEED